ncbi:hypothetical protein [Ferrovum sp.]|uniref:hypothetical protein n=1 Tax=Ferrovum sp. TaxID=2609467 RepID=UPI002629A500|nr:hypothetical protein [Ferrovum sp.]
MTAWTPERKARQSALIHSWRPWEQSTGPKTDEGKQEASRNRQRALEKARQEVADARKALTEAQDALERLGCKSTLDLAAIIALTKHF